MKREYFRQCEFRSGSTTCVAWIEERGATRGSLVCFQDAPQTWWEVVSVGADRITREQAKRQERRYRAFQRSLG